MTTYCTTLCSVVAVSLLLLSPELGFRRANVDIASSNKASDLQPQKRMFRREGKRERSRQEKERKPMAGTRLCLSGKTLNLHRRTYVNLTELEAIDDVAEVPCQASNID